MDVIKAIEAEQLKENAENFSVGDTVKVYFKIVEGANERIQVFEGLVIAKSNSGIRRTFMVRKISYGVGVERIFPLHSPRVEKVEVIRRGRVRRAKLYYVRDKIGKAAKVPELIVRKKNA
ncbi:MAG: 50S ribosomal protein L19 [Sphaerochaetaceae bacterium]|nr:50S ribosomal protein L19 [Sphaerochaetaceae bacterium]